MKDGRRGRGRGESSFLAMRELDAPVHIHTDGRTSRKHNVSNVNYWMGASKTFKQQYIQE